ncbi:MAG: MarR family winged helix-turn-helix transcriptional regulator [Phycisphaerae bacterium]
MVAKPDESLESMAGEIFELYRLIALARSRRPSEPEVLSEPEFLTLDELIRHAPQTIGDIQKKIGVAPAQMSRIVRTLGRQGGDPLIECRINPNDRRRIDMTITNEGKEAYGLYRANRLGSMHAILGVLAANDRTHFMRILRLIRDAFSDLVTAESSDSDTSSKR